MELSNGKMEAVKAIYIPEASSEVDTIKRDQLIGRATREIEALRECSSPFLVKLGSIQPKLLNIDGNELVVPWAGIQFSSEGDEIGQNVLGSGLIGQYQKGADGKINLEIVYPFDVASADMIYPFPQY